MMTSISGDRGIGKTYFLAKKAYQAFLDGYLVITNFSHIYSHIDCSKESPEVLYDIIREIGIFKERGYDTYDLFPEFRHSGVMILLDEAHLYFSADLFKRYQIDDQFQYVLKFLAQARKADIEIFYSSQDPAKIDKNWRRYTEEYIRFRAVIPFRYKKYIKHPTKPMYKREVRYPIPLVWEEHHKLDQDNPAFNYAKVRDDEGVSHWAAQSTLLWRRIVLSGWMDPFPYRLYDSNQMLAMMGDPTEEEFKHLKKFAYIPYTMRPDSIPTLKKMFGITPNDEKVPIRFQFKDIKLPALNSDFSRNAIKQPIELLDDLSFYKKRKSRSLARGAARAANAEPLAAAPKRAQAKRPPKDASVSTGE